MSTQTKAFKLNNFLAWLDVSLDATGTIFNSSVLPQSRNKLEMCGGRVNFATKLFFFNFWFNGLCRASLVFRFSSHVLKHLSVAAAPHSLRWMLSSFKFIRSTLLKARVPVITYIPVKLLTHQPLSGDSPLL